MEEVGQVGEVGEVGEVEQQGEVGEIRRKVEEVVLLLLRSRQVAVLAWGASTSELRRDLSELCLWLL